MATLPNKRSKVKDDSRKVGADVRGRGILTTTMAAAAMVPADKPLTDMQRAFVKAWAEGDSIYTAMARAGYNDQPSYGYRMAKMPNILEAYHAEKRKYEEACDMSRKKVMDMLLESYEMAKLMAEPASMVSAAREIGKMCGYYEPARQKIELTVNGQVAVKRIESMSDEDLIKMVADGMAAMALPQPHDPQGEDDDPDSF